MPFKEPDCFVIMFTTAIAFRLSRHLCARCGENNLGAMHRCRGAASQWFPGRYLQSTLCIGNIRLYLLHTISKSKGSTSILLLFEERCTSSRPLDQHPIRESVQPQSTPVSMYIVFPMHPTHLPYASAIVVNKAETAIGSGPLTYPLEYIGAACARICDAMRQYRQRVRYALWCPWRVIKFRCWICWRAQHRTTKSSMNYQDL